MFSMKPVNNTITVIEVDNLELKTKEAPPKNTLAISPIATRMFV